MGVLKLDGSGLPEVRLIYMYTKLRAPSLIFTERFGILDPPTRIYNIFAILIRQTSLQKERRETENGGELSNSKFQFIHQHLSKRHKFIIAACPYPRAFFSSQLYSLCYAEPCCAVPCVSALPGARH
jgi:hypothetical protein